MDRTRVNGKNQTERVTMTKIEYVRTVRISITIWSALRKKPTQVDCTYRVTLIRIQTTIVSLKTDDRRRSIQT